MLPSWAKGDELKLPRLTTFRDLKLDNTLLDGKSPGRVKLCDFGFAKQWDADKNMFTHIG